ncbi:MAG: Eco57I restriction-modification methylase domain-containing protein [Capnocytophaga gingivalis]|uniref:Eco57I restriction-modification methylase domain-containing protein n=1 Tax=Capnocytophaga gingivalis TaxID=1017 RepID=UPI00288C4DFC|nr:Eco57I restriction-modification methylase domain-containing protein [Capnocytophaga gingivalis]
MNSNIPATTKNEKPKSYADRLGAYYAKEVSQTHKKTQGQFFTPLKIASYMASLAISEKTDITLLDPGCGTAVLSCSLVEHLISENPYIQHIHLAAYETDQQLIPLTQKSLNYLQQWAQEKDITLDYKLYTADFVLDNYESLYTESSIFDNQKTRYDFIICNPPYFKLSKEDKRVKATAIITDGQPNIYAAFLAIASRLLKGDGEMIFITPRSFTSGRYFNSFRDYFFKQVQFDFIHLFESRKDTFGKDKVLQETLILRAKPLRLGNTPEICLASSSGLQDIASSQKKMYPQSTLINLNSKEKIIHLPTNDKQEAIINLFKSWKGSLNQYDIQISTGPVVAFRVRDFIKETNQGKTTLLYWLHNVLKMGLIYPLYKPNKPPYIQVCEQTKAYLIPNRNYVFLRRFSAKDDKSRLIAAPYFSSPETPMWIGVENKLNYIYRPKGHLSRTEVMGIVALLNSELFDTYFRTFNGNVNVSATELRAMPMPPLETIKEIGKTLILLNDFSMENVSKVVASFFKLEQL